MVALDTIRPHLTHDFVQAFRTLGKQVGYRNLGRAIAYAKLPTATADKELPVTAATPEESIPDRGSLGDLERPKKGPIWVRAFTPCERHAAEDRKILSVHWEAHVIETLLKGCDGCKYWTGRYARIMAEEMVERNGQKPHSNNKWWYQKDCQHGSRRADCPKCWKQALQEWKAAAANRPKRTPPPVACFANGYETRYQLRNIAW